MPLSLNPRVFHVVLRFQKQMQGPTSQSSKRMEPGRYSRFVKLFEQSFVDSLRLGMKANRQPDFSSCSPPALDVA